MIYLDDSYVKFFEEITVGDLPKFDFTRVTSDTPITKILELIEKYHQMNFPVVSPTNQLLGIVDFDDVKDYILKNQLSETAGTIMRKEFIFVVPADPLSTALDRMRKFDLELLPIVNISNLNLLGTITRDAILRFVRIRALGASITPEDLETIEAIDLKLKVEAKREPEEPPKPDFKEARLSEEQLPPTEEILIKPEEIPKLKAKKKKVTKKKKSAKKKKGTKKKKSAKKKKGTKKKTSAKKKKGTKKKKSAKKKKSKSKKKKSTSKKKSV